MDIDNGTRLTFGPVLVALYTMPSTLKARPLIKPIRRMETVITLSARLVRSSIPVTFRLFSRETFPSNLIPGVDADKAIVSGTVVLCCKAAAPTAR